MPAARSARLRDIESEIFMAIGPCRIAVLSLLVLMNETSTEDGFDHDAVIKTSLSRITRAYGMLNSQIAELLKPVDFTPPSSFLQTQQKALEALTLVYDPIVQHSDTPLDALRQIDNFRTLALAHIEPLVTDFLTEMTSTLRKEQNRRDQARLGDTMQTVEAAEIMGRSIHLIAINASIEAARVGDAGCGFKLIAENIRDLAGRTQILLQDISKKMTRH